MIQIARTNDLAACHAVRRVVFIEEQGVSVEDEVDGRDGEAIQLLATDEAGAVGTARILTEGDTGKIGRVAVLKSHRGTGLGKALILACLDELRQEPGISRAKLGAQTHAIGFYEALGFAVCSDEYIDAGITHRDMDRAL